MRYTLPAMLAILMLVAGCTGNPDGPFGPAPSPAMRALAAPQKEAETAQTDRNFVAVLSGDQETPPRPSRGRGVATFHLSKDGTRLGFRLIVANIENVVAAHIHLAPAGVPGPIVLPLYSAVPAGGRIEGPIAEGILTPADLTGPLAGSASFDLFLSALHADSLYVNVHTNDGVPPPDTGPGDFPAGEIRGQLR